MKSYPLLHYFQCRYDREILLPIIVAASEATAAAEEIGPSFFGR